MNAKNQEFYEIADQLITAGRFIDSKGWVPATSGNFSARLSDGNLAITVSGRHKGHLTPADIMLVDNQGNSLDGQKPSAETLLHTAIYRRFPDVGSVLHPHSINATLAGQILGDQIVFENYELLKAFRGIDTHEAKLIVPIFPNDQNIPRLAARVDEYLDTSDFTYAYIIAGHGFYTWGSSVKEALRYIEAVEFLLECEIRIKSLELK